MIVGIGETVGEAGIEVLEDWIAAVVGLKPSGSIFATARDFGVGRGPAGSIIPLK